MRESGGDGKALARYGARVQRIAFYDMDKTVTKTPTYEKFLLHAALKLSPWRLFLAPFAIVTTALYLLRAISRARLKEWNQRLLLGRAVRAERMRPVVDSFAARTIARNVRTDALARIAADKAAGYRLVLATASYRLYVVPIAARLGFDDVIATGSRVGLGDAILARIEGENCYGAAKLAMIEAWLAAARVVRAEAHIRAYSDHASDAPMLALADEAFAVAPHGPLRRLAAERGWTVVDWR